MGGRNSGKEEPKNQLRVVGTVFGIVLLVLILFKAGVFTAIAGIFVHHAIDSMQAETERQQNQPRIVVLKSGERIPCKRVLDQVKYWGMILPDGRSSVIKKEEVLEILTPEPEK